MNTTVQTPGDAGTLPGAKHYSMTITWSERDQAYLVNLPEWQDQLIGPAATHGATYEEAARNGQIVLEMLIADAVEDGEALPEPKVFPLA